MPFVLRNCRVISPPKYTSESWFGSPHKLRTTRTAPESYSYIPSTPGTYIIAFSCLTCLFFSSSGSHCSSRSLSCREPGFELPANPLI